MLFAYCITGASKPDGNKADSEEEDKSTTAAWITLRWLRFLYKLKI